MAFTRNGTPLWIYYQQQTPISDLSDIRENNLYFMIEEGLQCEIVTIMEKNLLKNTITIKTFVGKIEKRMDLQLWKNKKLKFFENEIDP